MSFSPFLSIHLSQYLSQYLSLYLNIIYRHLFLYIFLSLFLYLSLSLSIQLTIYIIVSVRAGQWNSFLRQEMFLTCNILRTDNTGNVWLDGWADLLEDGRTVEDHHVEAGELEEEHHHQAQQEGLQNLQLSLSFNIKQVIRVITHGNEDGHSKPICT